MERMPFSVKVRVGRNMTPMGLREKKAARTREQIIDAALDLFVAQGYEQTTIEQIAERAEVGTSTLYRYFASKDLILIDRISTMADLGSRLRSRPGDEPLRVALAEALRASVESFADDPRSPAMRKIIDNAPGPRARLWDVFQQAGTDLGEAIAQRLGRDARDIHVMTTASMALEIYGLTAETWWSGDRTKSQTEVLQEVLASVNSEPPVIPALLP